MAWRALAGANFPPELGKPTGFRRSLRTFRDDGRGRFYGGVEKLETALGITDILRGARAHEMGGPRRGVGQG